MTHPTYKSWPFQEAQKVQKRFRDHPPTGLVRFETGYGPSGLPHIGTFAEVARTTWVRHAFEHLTGLPTELVAFSDDMDGLRKVPLNVPQREMLTEHLGKPLCTIPDPFGERDSYSGFMNNKLKEFLNAYQFEYRFQSSQEAYTRGDFNEGLEILLQKFDEVRDIILPTLGAEKRENWSPFFPVCEQCGRVYSTRVTGYHPENNTVDYACDKQEGLVKSCGHTGNTSIFNGQVKVGWKVDWALRWYCYEIAYEMYGKDLIESANLSGKICRLMGKQPPTGFFYELFLDEEGKKISKSVGKGLTIDTWTQYAPLESLLYYLFQSPTQAKRLFWGSVPKSVDDYLIALKAYPALNAEKKADSPLWHIFNRGATVPEYQTSVNFSLINNLLAAIGEADAAVMDAYLNRYDPTAAQYAGVIDDLVHKAMNYYRDFVLPNKEFRTPTPDERAMLQQIHDTLSQYQGQDENELQAIPFEVANAHNVAAPEFFKMFYETVLGQERGPRFGSFVRMVGKDRVLALLVEAYTR